MRAKHVAIVAVAAIFIGALIGVTPAQGATTTDTIRTLNVTNWFGGNEGPGGSVGNVSLVPGPAPVPMGAGSAGLTVDSNGRASLGTNRFAGTRLDALTALDYWGFVAGSPGNQLVLQFDVDYDSTDAITAYQGRLSFVPDTNPPADAWRHLDALADGKWFGSQAPGNATCNQTTLCTWAQVLAAFPDAAIRNDSVQHGALLFRLGGPVPGGATAHVDALTLSTASDTTITDFEPGGTVTPTVGQAGTTVTVTAHGVKPKVRMNAFYAVTDKRKIRICTVKKTPPNGVAQCVGTIPPANKAGLAGVHQILLRGRSGGYKLDYVADFILTP